MKNKYFYPIYKLKIKSWIKYWLIKQTEFKGVLSDILEDISFYLTDSLNMKFKIFDIIGRSVQDGDPTPENPVPIKNTGDNGSVNEKVQNKNLLASENINVKVAGVTYKSQEDGTILANGEKYGGAYVRLNTITLEEGTYSSKQFLLSGSIKKDGNDVKPTVYLAKEDLSETYNISEIGNPGISNTIPAGTYFIRIAVWNDNVVFTNAKIGLMLVKGSTIPDEFVPHSEQNLSFPLAEGQKLMQGDYPDDDEKVHHKMKEWVLNENNISMVTNYGTGYNVPRVLLNKTTLGYKSSWESGICLMSKYKEAKKITDIKSGTFTTINGANEVEIYDDRFTDLATARDLLIGTVIQIKLAEETTEDFTEEQKTAWEQIKKARTYKNVTHISSEDETPALLKIQYWKEG